MILSGTEDDNKNNESFTTYDMTIPSTDTINGVKYNVFIDPNSV